MRNPFTAILAGLLIGFSIVAAINPTALKPQGNTLQKDGKPILVLMSDPIAF
jgi:hypothetical protein